MTDHHVHVEDDRISLGESSSDDEEFAIEIMYQVQRGLGAAEPLSDIENQVNEDAVELVGSRGRTVEPDGSVVEEEVATHIENSIDPDRTEDSHRPKPKSTGGNLPSGNLEKSSDEPGEGDNSPGTTIGYDLTPSPVRNEMTVVEPEAVERSSDGSVPGDGVSACHEDPVRTNSPTEM